MSDKPFYRREILFRGQTRRFGERVNMRGDKLPAQWVYGGILMGGGDFSIIYGSADPDNINAATIEKYCVYTDTIGQFTGREDNSNPPKKIFEGDILLGQWEERPDEYSALVTYLDEGTVSWDQEWGRWIVTDTADTFSLYDWCEQCFVVGNIHEKEERNV